MKKLLFLFLAISACASLPAQNFSLITGREPVTSLDGLWRFHAGDNPAWANPGFDDSNWPLVRSDESWDVQGYSGYSGYAWYRCKLQVPDGSRPPDLLLASILTGYRLYANGRLVGGKGSIAPTRNPVIAFLPEVYRLPTGSAGPQFIQLAIRVWHVKGLGLRGGMQQPASVAGAPALLARKLSRDQDARTANDVNAYGYCFLALLVGLTTLVLFFSRTEDREYLWFSVMLLAGGAAVAFSIAADYVQLPFTLFQAVAAVAEGTSVIAALFFFSTVLRTRKSFLWWLACAGAAVYPIGLLLYYFRWATWGEGHAFGISLMLPADIWFVSILAISAVRKGVAVRWLLAPAVLYYGSHLINHLSLASVQLGWQGTRIALDFALISRPFPLSLFDIFGYLFVLSLLIFLVRRFSAARQEETRLSQEMEAARGVQSLLIHAVPPATPGFSVENVYLPAQEVGGDFFQVLPGDDGSLLIVVGDVSGKGLKAAMTVSAVVGALHGCTLRNPAQVLTYLNHALHGQVDGFFTCCAALVDADGNLTLSNAGHLPPYLNGEELAVASGLPLGIAAEGSYQEMHDKLAPGDRLTFLSDGVVEARNPSGQLFGFERTAAISSQTADQIAKAAELFGQEDDITVLTVTLTAKLQETTA